MPNELNTLKTFNGVKSSPMYETISNLVVRLFESTTVALNGPHPPCLVISLALFVGITMKALLKVLYGFKSFLSTLKL